MANSISTWGDGVTYTFKTRETWRHGNGAATARINTSHFTRLRGSSYPLNKISQPVMQQVCVELEDEGKSDATINRIVSAVSTVLNHLAFDEIIPSAPKLRRRKEVEHRLAFFTQDEVQAMALAARHVWDRADLADIIMFAGYSGLRQGEILALKAEDIDLAKGLIHVGGREGFTTKAGNYRTVPIHRHIKDLLQHRLLHSSKDVRIFGDEWRDKDQLIRAFRKVRAYIGKGDEYVFHTLRHSFASWAIEADVNIRTIQDLLGHRRIETTLRYAKVSDKTRDKAILEI